MKENLKPCVYKQREREAKRDLVPFVEWTGELRYAARLRTDRFEAEAKASLKRAKVIWIRPETTVIYAWPG